MFLPHNQETEERTDPAAVSEPLGGFYMIAAKAPKQEKKKMMMEDNTTLKGRARGGRSLIEQRALFSSRNFTEIHRGRRRWESSMCNY